MGTEHNAFNRMSENLKNQDYELKVLNDHQIIITGIPTITKFMAGILIAVGIVLAVIGILSLTLKDPEIISGILFILVGLFMSGIPFYNYYSRKSFKVDINKDKKYIFIRNNIFLHKSLHVTFVNIRGIIFKETDVNTFVDDKSKSSFVKNFTIELDTFKNTNPTLIRFIDKNEHTREFSNYFTSYISSFIDKNIEEKVIN